MNGRYSYIYGIELKPKAIQSAEPYFFDNREYFNGIDLNSPIYYFYDPIEKGRRQGWFTQYYRTKNYMMSGLLEDCRHVKMEPNLVFDDEPLTEHKFSRNNDMLVMPEYINIKDGKRVKFFNSTDDFVKDAFIDIPELNIVNANMLRYNAGYSISSDFSNYKPLEEIDAVVSRFIAFVNSAPYYESNSREQHDWGSVEYTELYWKRGNKKIFLYNIRKVFKDGNKVGMWIISLDDTKNVK